MTTEFCASVFSSSLWKCENAAVSFICHSLLSVALVYRVRNFCEKFCGCAAKCSNRYAVMYIHLEKLFGKTKPCQYIFPQIPWMHMQGTVPQQAVSLPSCWERMWPWSLQELFFNLWGDSSTWDWVPQHETQDATACQSYDGKIYCSRFDFFIQWG
jgi:hypothetical protein